MKLCYIIAEAGVNHNGKLKYAIELVKAAAASGADAVKFQTFDADSVIIPGTPTADYQKVATGNSDQYEMVKSLELSDKEFLAIKQQCDELNIEFMSTPFDVRSVTLLQSLGVKRLKVASGELTNEYLLEKIAETTLPLILSTGMADIDEVKEAISFVSGVWDRCIDEVVAVRPELTLLHCTSNYPTSFADVNLLAMMTLQKETGLSVGYSDHTLGSYVAPLAVAMGASVIEKHLTLDNEMAGPDHKASLNPQAFAEMVGKIRQAELVLGSETKAPCYNELPIRDLVRRSVYYSHDLRLGDTLRIDDIMFMRPGTGVPVKGYQDLVGRTLKCDVKGGAAISLDDLE